ncbi:excinuclease ABC subunit UvrC [Streptobacillus moniliformis]|uniref:excinuclease ABC subunit UvrC n=1 Tax=Streptobacillus moniliformis TaxID=34105 RepID=UPI0007E3415E|nr:excinuclease ABC subunit UvrC [Streptobacillus moniliformis]
MFDIKNIPTNPGVYMMKDINDKVIYVGKAKNLKNRVSSYFNNPKSSMKTFELIKHIKDIEFFLCNSELEALILENNLIKKYLPKYNILLKDNKTYPYLKITTEKIPQISVVRSRKHLEESTETYYFGPYPFNMKEMIKLLLSAFDMQYFNIDMYNKKIIGNNLRYNNLNKELYFENVEDENKYIENSKAMINFLKNKDVSIIDKLHNQMIEYSENLDYEKALIMRNRIEKLNALIKTQLIEHSQQVDEDVFVLTNIGNNIFMCILNIRDGKIIGKNNIRIDNKYEEQDIFEDLFLSYYDNKKIPKNIIIENKYKSNIDILEKYFSTEKNKLVKIHAPIIKSRRLSLLELGKKNLNYYLDEYMRTEKAISKGLIDLKNVLNLKKLPKIIECFDISNIQGKDAVSAMSVTVNGKADNKRYRHFKITVKDTPDDFMMMRETLMRRYSKLEIDELPDVILIDGGKGQLGVAVDVLKELGKFEFLDIISIAKKEELIFKAEESVPYRFDKNDEALKILIRTRDEVHRFGITYHRKLRSKRNIKSVLDEIRGIGPKRKKELILKFGSIKNILEASEKELLEILPLNVVKEIKKI